MAFDPGELEAVEERLFALRAAARKHQTTCDGLVEVLARYQGDLETLQSGKAASRRSKPRRPRPAPAIARRRKPSAPVAVPRAPR